MKKHKVKAHLPPKGIQEEIMKGADKYCRLFNKAEQHGRLYLLPHYHARGKTFRIYVLPEGEAVIPNGGFNPPLNKDAVEVYGIAAGQPGWTEEYGWLHEGPWKEDFKMICNNITKWRIIRL